MKLKALLALLVLFCILLPGLAQTKPAAPPPPQQTSDDKDDVVRITTNLVQVDAVVTKDGQHVRDLTVNDFEIYEDGKRQEITSFAYVSNVPGMTPQPVAVPAKRKSKDIAPAAPLRRDDPHRTIALVVDDLGLSAESMGHVVKQLRKFIAEQLQPNDLVAIIRTGGEVGALQQFTNDPRVLNRAVDKLRWNARSRVGLYIFPPVGSLIDDGTLSRSTFSYSFSPTMTALRFIIEAMGELPGRKSLVIMSDDLPVESQEFGPNFDSRMGRSTVGGFNADSPAANSAFGDSSLSNAGLLQKVAEKAIRSSVVIYSVDTQGLVITGITAADSFHGDPRTVGARMNDLLSSRSRLALIRREGGDLLARQTGGFQVRNSNDFQLKRVLEDQSGYYVLGYRPTDETFNKRFHHIKAKVKRSGMTLRTRFGFLGVSEEEAKKTQRSVVDMTNLALASPFGAQEINVDVTSFFISDKTAGSIVRSFVYIDAKDVTFTPAEGRQQAAIDLHGAIFGDNGIIVEQVRRGASLSLSESDYQHAMRSGMQLFFDIPVKRAGAYQVRIAARDKPSSRIGSAGQFVTVPDLTKKKFAVSGIILGTGKDSTGQGLAGPGARRFTSNTDLYFAYMLYNAAYESGGLRNLLVQAKLFRDGKHVYSGPETPISSANQVDPGRVVATGMLHLPADLEPGNYYLQVVITEELAKNKTTPLIQWVDFDIE